jgi:hypothetical protein
MWFLKNTFGIITLQVGIICFSAVFIVRKKLSRYFTMTLIIIVKKFQTLAACILLVNVLSLENEEPSMKHLFISIKSQIKLYIDIS